MASRTFFFFYSLCDGIFTITLRLLLRFEILNKKIKEKVVLVNNM